MTKRPASYEGNGSYPTPGGRGGMSWLPGRLLTGFSICDATTTGDSVPTLSRNRYLDSLVGMGCAPENLGFAGSYGRGYDRWNITVSAWMKIKSFADPLAQALRQYLADIRAMQMARGCY